MSQFDDQRSIISTSTFLSWNDDDGQGEEEGGDREPPEMKYCPSDPKVVVKSEPQEEAEGDNNDAIQDAVSSLNSIYESGNGDEEDGKFNSEESGVGGLGRDSRRRKSSNFKETDSESDWEEEWVKKNPKKRGSRGGGKRKGSPKRSAKKQHAYKPISELTPEQQEKRREMWRMQDIKKSGRVDKPKKRKKRISELTPEQQERRRALWREQKMRKMERREVLLREVIKDELVEEDWGDEGEGKGEERSDSVAGGGEGSGGNRRKRIGEMTEEEREKWRARWRLDSARRIAKKKGLPVPEKLEDIQQVKSRDSSCSFDSSDDSSKSAGNAGGSGEGGGGGSRRRQRKKISDLTDEEKEKKSAKWRLERARKIARAKGLPVPEKLEDIPVKRETSADSTSKNTSGGGGGGSRKKRVADMTEEEKEAIRARWRLERQRKRERAMGLPQSTKIEQCTSKPRNPRNVRTLKDAITEEEREKVRAQYKRDMERRRQRYKTFTPEQKNELYQKMKFYKITKIARMSEDELKMYKMNQYFKYQARKANLTEEQIERRRQTVQARSKRKWQEIKQSPEALERLKEARKQYRQNLSPEKKERFLEKLRENGRNTLMRKRQAMGDFRPVVPRGPGGKGRRGLEEWKFRKRLTEEEKEKKNEWRRIVDKKRRLEQRLTMQNLMDGGMTMEQIMQQTETGQQRKRRLFKLRINKAKRELRKTLTNHNLPPEEINQRLVELEASYQPSREFRPYKPRKDGDSQRVDPKELEFLEEILKNHPGAKIQGRAPAGSKKSRKKSTSPPQPAIPSINITTSTPTLFTTPIPSTSKRRGRPSSKIISKVENPPELSPPSTSTFTPIPHQLFQHPPPPPHPPTWYAPQSSNFSQPSYPNPSQTHYPYTTQPHHSFFHSSQSQNQPQPTLSSSSYSLQKNILENIGGCTSISTSAPPQPSQQYCPSSTTSSQYGGSGYEEAGGPNFDGDDDDDNSLSYHDDPIDNDYSPPPSPTPPPPPPRAKRGNHRSDHYHGFVQNYQQNYFEPPPQQAERTFNESSSLSVNKNDYLSRPPKLPTTSLDPTKKPRVRKKYPTKLRPGAKPRTKRADVVRDAVCDECGKAFNSMYVREHQRIYHSPHYDPIKMECLICNEKFKVSKKWYQHYLHDHLGQVKMRRGLKTEDITIICEECGEPFKDKFRLKRHMHYVHGEGQKPENQFNCPVEGCKFHTKDGASMQRHIKRVHADLGEVFFCTGKIKCWRCPRSDFKNEVDLRVHVKECHPESSFPCDWCGAVKFTQLALNLHYSTNKCAKRPKGAEKRGMKQVEGLPFLSIERALVGCPICGKELRIMTLTGHLKLIHNVEERKEWRCVGGGGEGKCGKVYKRREFYAGHLEEAHEWKWEEMKGMMGEINGGNLEGMVKKKIYKHWTRIIKGEKRGEGSEGEEDEESSSESEDEDGIGRKKNKTRMVRGRSKRRVRRNVKVICEEDEGEDGEQEGDNEDSQFIT